MTKKALITGITGQDGSYLTELLLSKGYHVHGMVRRGSVPRTDRIDHLIADPANRDSLKLHYGDLADGNSLRRLIDEIAPDEVYNLAAQSHVKISFDQPEYTVDVTGTGALRLLEAIRNHASNGGKNIRFYQAGSSEMYGSAKPPQSEMSRFEPRSPYSCAKAFAHYQVINYRESYGMHASNGVLFNHESPRRGEAFVTRKITRAATRIKCGIQDKLTLGNLDAKRDWGFAGDYVEAMWLMLQKEYPGDYVVATGVSITIEEFLTSVFSHLEMDWKKYVQIDPRFFRPAEVDYLLGDPSKAKAELGWTAKTDISALAKMMVESDLVLAQAEQKSGYRPTSMD
jgi:GDPmannose 4,6-dehydratase